MAMYKKQNLFNLGSEVFLLLLLLVGCSKSSDPIVTRVTDIDGNEYNTVIIGKQTWMTEDLRTTTYNDGTPIHLLTASEYQCKFFQLFCHTYLGPYYMNSLTSVQGRAYDFDAINSGKLAPKGWHVPSNEDMATLVEYLGGSDIAGGKLKETGISHWQAPNTGATNESGFSAIPAYSNKIVSDTDGTAVNYWSLDYISGTGGRLWILYYNSGHIVQSYSNLTNLAYTVRCIKDK
jgi:uncharacterized protein (TIGR02145 family)